LTAVLTVCSGSMVEPVFRSDFAGCGWGRRSTHLEEGRELLLALPEALLRPLDGGVVHFVDRNYQQADAERLQGDWGRSFESKGCTLKSVLGVPTKPRCPTPGVE